MQLFLILVFVTFESQGKVVEKKTVSIFGLISLSPMGNFSKQFYYIIWTKELKIVISKVLINHSILHQKFIVEWWHWLCPLICLWSVDFSVEPGALTWNTDLIRKDLYMNFLCEKNTKSGMLHYSCMLN